MRLISHRFMGESYAELSLVLMAASYINFTGWEGGRQATPILHGFSYHRLLSSSLELASMLSGIMHSNCQLSLLLGDGL